MLFQPSIHGWPFPDTVTSNPDASAGAAPTGVLGLGAGMCWTALDRYLGGVRIARDVAAPEPGNPLHAELVRRQASAVCGLWPRVREWQALSDRKLASMTRGTLRGIRYTLERGEPVLLALLPEADPYERGYAARHVLATGWSRAEKQVTLSIYDPARPNDNSARLRFSRSGPLEARLASGQTVRGFFPVLYETGRHGPMRAETFADRAVVGFNRTVHGQIGAAAFGTRLDVLARGTDGTLLHFRRVAGAHWESANVTEREGFAHLEAHGDPAVLPVRRTLNAFARGYVGDLLHFKAGRKWSAANVTEQKRTGPRFRLAGMPVPLAGAWRRVHVFGRDKDNGVVHYQTNLLGRWSAEQIAGDPIVGDPAPVRVGPDIHVFGRTADGRVVHWERAGTEWVPRDLSSHDRSTPPLRLTGAPVPLVHGSTIHVFGRDQNSRLVHFRRSADGDWRSVGHDIEIAGDPAATIGPAGVHVFAAGPNGALLHRWGSEEWRGENVSRTRESLVLPPSPPRRLTAWGAPTELNVVGRWGDEVITLTWRETWDWVAVPLQARTGVEPRHVPADDPIVIMDRSGSPHLFAVDAKGNVIHIEPAGRPRPEPRRAEAATRASRPERAQGAGATPPAVPAPDAAPDAAPARASEPAPAREPEPVPVLEPAPTTDTDTLPLLDFPAVQEEEPAQGETQGKESGSQTDPRDSWVEFAPLEVTPEPGTTEAPIVAEAPVISEGSVVSEESVVPEEPVVADESIAAEEPVAERENRTPRPQDFEPMDLTTVDIAPPEPRSRRQRRKRKKA